MLKLKKQTFEILGRLLRDEHPQVALQREDLRHHQVRRESFTAESSGDLLRLGLTC